MEIWNTQASQFPKEFDTTSKDLQENENQPTDCTRIIQLSETTSQVMNIIEQKALELDLYVECKDSNLFVWGSTYSADLFNYFVTGFNLGRESLDTRASYHKEIKLSDSIKSCLAEVERFAQALQVKFQPNENNALLSGNLENVTDFIHHLYSLNIKQDLSLQEKSEGKSGPEREEMSISTFHRTKKNEIYQKALSLNIFIDFAYDIVVAQGDMQNLKDFKIYLNDIETEGKKALYPLYWDIYEPKIYSEVIVEPSSEEFKTVKTMISQTLPSATVNKLVRVQNKYLMDHYVTAIQKRQELNQFNNKVNFDRKALFHGTGKTAPSEIFMNSDTGFDINFSKLGTFYGQGLYFAEQAAYSHQNYKYIVGENHYQMLLADVFVGNAYSSDRDQKLRKAPHGFDSVKGIRDKFYVIYNNFHSYPLYLIDYSIKNDVSNNQKPTGLFGASNNSPSYFFSKGNP